MLVGSDQGPAMNAFYEHHRDSIRFGYRCLDRILLNGLIQPFQQPERVVGFFDTYRRVYPVSRDVLRGAAEQFQDWVKDQADRWNAKLFEAPRKSPLSWVEATNQRCHWERPTRRENISRPAVRIAYLNRPVP